MVIAMKKQLVCGVGLNDADYKVNPVIGGSRYACPFYVRWKTMISRCYNPKFHIKNPSYIGCSVCEEWLIFSNFKAWMQSQEWDGMDLDKDLLFFGNKVYSPETCMFVSRIVNSFTTDARMRRGKCLIGVSYCKSRNKFEFNCSNPFTKKPVPKIYFDTEIEAHLQWVNVKSQLAEMLAEIQVDSRVAKALRNRYASLALQAQELKKERK